MVRFDALSVGGKDGEGLPTGAAQDPEVTMVEGQHPSSPVSVGKDNDRRIGKTDLEVGVACDELARDGDVVAIERCQLERSPRHLVEQGEFPIHPSTRQGEVVDLGQHER